MGMYGFLNAVPGWMSCRVTGTMPAAFLNRCVQQGVPMVSAASEDAFTLRVRFRSRDLRRVKAIAGRTGCALEVLERGGAGAAASALLRRLVPVLGLLLAFCLLAWSKLYIWEIQVTGNETVSTGRILDALRECGITYGGFWPGITSDNLRSRLLTVLPELSWATVNIYGSRAEVIVRERIPKPEIWDPRAATDVVAAKAGFVTRVTALNGTAEVGPGSATAPGETLISHRMESGYGPDRAVHAAGSVLAETYYEFSAAAPLTVYKKTYTGVTRRLWSVTFGKKRFNFFRNSSISPVSCDKISKRYTLDSGGRFTLPVSFQRETLMEYTLTEQPRDQFLARMELERELRERLRREIGPAGIVERVHYSASRRGDALIVCLRAKCNEEIGVERPVTPAQPVQQE